MARTLHHVDRAKVPTAPKKWNACPDGKGCVVCGRWWTRRLAKRVRRRETQAARTEVAAT